MSKEDFYELTPDEVMHAVESVGYRPTGEFAQLNSYENRVFDIKLESADRVKKESIIAKFYRPGRWNRETILEEHDFLNDLKENGMPVIAPLQIVTQNSMQIRSADKTINIQTQSLALDRNIWFALWPKAYGRMLDELMPEDYPKLGRTLARFHNIGEQKKFHFRPTMDTENYGWGNLDILEPRIAPEVRSRYLDAASMILEFLDDRLDARAFIRIHGDCHRGNILKMDTRMSASGDTALAEFMFVDFDDCCTGHPVQDMWMLLSSDENSAEGRDELDLFLDGYREFRNFETEDLELIPGFRGLRIIHYAAWIARRWDDPSFPRLFPQFEDYNYWAGETEALERIARLI